MFYQSLGRMETSIWKEYEISSKLYLNKPELPVTQRVVKCKKLGFLTGCQPFEVKIGRGASEIKKGAMRVAPFFEPEES